MKAFEETIRQGNIVTFGKRQGRCETDYGTYEHCQQSGIVMGKLPDRVEGDTRNETT
jgi:hypothetical protein